MTNTVFVCYAMSIHMEILRTPRLTNELFSKYEGAAKFRADLHHVFIQARADPRHRWFKLPYVVTELDVTGIVQLWPAEWLQDIGKKPYIPVPLATNIGAGTS